MKYHNYDVDGKDTRAFNKQLDPNGFDPETSTRQNYSLIVYRTIVS
jgi:hypothetical protein